MSGKHLERWHGAHHYSDKVHLLFVAFIFFSVFTLLWSYFSLSSTLKKSEKNVQSPAVKLTPTPSPTPTPPDIKPTKGVACTQEAMLCPDGKTWVGRTGPNCEFSQCP